MIRAFDYDVFISYSSNDKEIVHPLARQLKREGLRIWLDDWLIQSADSIPLKIQNGLEHSRTLLMCMSPSYFKSEWCKLEYNTILFRDPTNMQRRFIPLLIKDCALPDTIAQFAYIDWRVSSSDNYHKLLTTLRTEGLETAFLKKRFDSARNILRGHSGYVRGIAITPDGRTIISGSHDTTLKVWDLATGQCRATFKGHHDTVYGVAITSDGKTVVSGSGDTTLKVWDLATGQCRATFNGHDNTVYYIAITPDNKTVVSGSHDNTLKVWDLATGYCHTTLRGHTSSIVGVSITPDGKTIVSSSFDNTLKLWSIITGECYATLKGHTSMVYQIAITPDGKKAVSGSNDKTLKIWDLKTGQCCATFEGHTKFIYGVAITPDGKTVVSGSGDKTLKIWDLATGQCRATLKGHTKSVHNVVITPDNKTIISGSDDRMLRVWDIPPVDILDGNKTASYTNAKVALIGKTGVGKSGLAMRLCDNHWEPTESTHGMNVTQIELPDNKCPTNIEREVWLWDFAGQTDYRLIHQLYIDETSLGIIVFDPQDDNPFEEIGYWNKALSVATKYQPVKLLVAARCDRGGITISQNRFKQYIQEQGIASLLTTAAKTGEGCEQLKKAIADHIPWERLPWTASSRLFKSIKDSILQFRNTNVLLRLSELRQRLQLLLPGENIDEADLLAVIGLMQGQGILQMLSFGEFILLQPEWINRYASVIVRMAHDHIDEIGAIGERKILDGDLDYKGMGRLSHADEKILLRCIVQTFLDHFLCLREETPSGTMLIFPSYFNRNKPDLPDHPHVFVTYKFSGPLDEIYSTLVVCLSYSGGFIKDLLWKDAADFITPGGKRAGLAMVNKAEGTAEIIVYFDDDVPDDTKVIFTKYIHEHLLARAQPGVTRMRTFICADCNVPIDNNLIQARISRGSKDILCPICEKTRILLVDSIEKNFYSNGLLKQVQQLNEQASIKQDNQSLELILTGHTITTAGEAGQIYRPLIWADYGIDGEIEFKDNNGKASGQRIYLQLKSGDSYLYHRKRDDVEVFNVKEERHVNYWLSQAYPVMLVIRTSDGKIRWMNVTEYLQRHGPNIRQIIFKGEPFTASNIVKMRDKILNRPRIK